MQSLFASRAHFSPLLCACALLVPVLLSTCQADDAQDAKSAGLTEGAAVALGMVKTPQGQAFEAENYKATSDAFIVDSQGASKGKAVKSERDWQPLVMLPLPEGSAWKVWVRRKGGPFAIKTKTGDRWFWGEPSEWTWTETDVFSREELGGAELRIGRGSGKSSLLVDALVLSPEKKRELPADAPDATLPAQNIGVSVDWSANTGVMSPRMWGINDDTLLTPQQASDPAYQQLLGQLQPSFIRIHNANLTNIWTNGEQRNWDSEKIRASFAASTGYGNAQILLNIPRWPNWLSKNKILTPEQEDEFAALCASLVRVMRDQMKRHVDYWEITNELDNEYEKSGQLDNLWRLYNKCAAAMRAVDPKAKLGGPALTWAKPQWVEGFLTHCPDAQFISWHNYGTGDLYESNEKIFSTVNSNIGNLAQGVVSALRRTNRTGMETFLTETNVKYTWDPYERRHQNQVGSLFHASVVIAMADQGLSGVNLWQQRGNAYGSLIDPANKTFPSYHLYRWGTRYLSGKRAKATSSDETQLQVLAITNQNNQKSILLLNKSPRTLQAPAAQQLLPNARKMYTLTAGNNYAETTAPKTKTLNIPGYSLLLLTTSSQ